MDKVGRTEFVLMVDQIWSIPDDVDQEDVFDLISECLTTVAESWGIHSGGSLQMVRYDTWLDKYGDEES